MKKHILFLILFNVVSAGQLFSQKNEALADSIYLSGNDTLALKEYLRAFVLEPKISSSFLPFKISKLYRQFGQFEKAIHFADLYYFATNDPTQKDKALVEKIQNSVLLNDINHALVDASQIGETSVPQKNLKWFYMGYLFILNKEFTDAIDAFNQLSYIDENDKIELEKYVKSLQKINDKNPKKAMLMSAFVPGLGQAINGDIADGLNSIFLIGGLTTSYIYLTNTLSTTDAIVSVGPWVFRYFIGGLQNAEEQAKLNKLMKFQSKTMELVQWIQLQQINNNATTH